MTSVQVTLRSIAIAAAVMSAGGAAHALTIPFQGTQSNSVQAFSADARGGFRALDITVEAKGNAVALPSDPANPSQAYSFPVTKIVIGSRLNIASGSAVGSGLQITRYNDDDALVGFTLANFTINYETKQVLADTTPLAGTTSVQMPLYNFQVSEKLKLKYKFPLTITGHEVLNDLRLTEQAKAAFISSLELPVFAVPLLNNDFGTLTQDISTKARRPAASTVPYVPGR